MIDGFIEEVKQCDFQLAMLQDIKSDYNNLIFEGAQGIMLDQDFGFFPNVTRSNTTSVNALHLIRQYQLPMPNIVYCMRSYLTRHGNGYMPNEDSNLHFEDATNVEGVHQGKIRFGYHCCAMLKHALALDRIYSWPSIFREIKINCMDQTDYYILMDQQRYSFGRFYNDLNLKEKQIAITYGDSEQ